jgi:hypothetical protein
MGYFHPFGPDTETSQEFGANPNLDGDPENPNPSGGHTGKDLAVVAGTPIRAAGAGTIVAAQYFPDYNNEWLYGPMGGLIIVLDCGITEPTFGYAHCLAFFGNVGDTVTPGQIIGLSGNTGTVTTGAHCHVEALPPSWNVYGSNTYGRVNPDIYLSEYYESETNAMELTTITETAAENVAGIVDGAIRDNKQIQEIHSSIAFQERFAVESQQVLMNAITARYGLEKIDATAIATQVREQLAVQIAGK